MVNNIQITRLLEAWREDDPASQQALLAAVFPDLKKISANILARQSGKPSLQTTELVNEAYIKLAGQRNQAWDNRGHFFSIAARLMRRIIIDELRSAGSNKRGGDAISIDIDAIEVPAPASYPNWLELDQAMTELRDINPGAADVVEMRQMLGMSLEETAETLQIGTATVGRYWRFARAWLATRLNEHSEHDQA